MLNALLLTFPHLGTFLKYLTAPHPLHVTLKKTNPSLLLPLPSPCAATNKSKRHATALWHVPGTGSAWRRLKNKHIAKALCFQWQDGWEGCQPLAVTLLSCQLLAAMRMYVRYLLRKRALHLILPDGGGMIHTHISHARMTTEEKTFSFCFLFCVTDMFGGP